MGRGMIPVPSVPIRIGFLLLVLVVIIHDLVVGVIILALLGAGVGAGLLLGAALAEGTAIFGFVVALLIILFLG